MQIVSLGDDLYEMSNLIFWKIKKIINLLSAKFVFSMVFAKKF